MIRFIHRFVICAALLTLFFSTAAVKVQASASPCEMHNGQMNATINMFGC
jgi:hypothetical protein